MVPQMDEDTEQPDLSAGYCVELYVNADGTFTVSGPKPHEAEAVEGETEAAGGAPLPTIAAALKAIMQMVQDNPIGQSAQAGFEAGFSSGPNRA